MANVESISRLKYCPQCGAGFYPESTECGACHVPLADQPEVEVLSVHLPDLAKLAEERRRAADKLPDKLKVCPQCGVSVSAMLTVCPDCKIRLSRDPDIHVTEVCGVERQFAGGDAAFSLAALIAVLTLAAIGCGLLTLHLGLGVAYLALVLPALLLTNLRLGERQRRGEPVTWGHRLHEFVLNLFIVAGVVAGGLVGIVLLLAATFWILSLAMNAFYSF